MEREFEHRLTGVEERSKSNSHRLDEMEARQGDLENLISAFKVLADREERVENDVKEIKGDVKSLKEKPGKRWDAVVDKIIWAFLAAIIAYMLGNMGL